VRARSVKAWSGFSRSHRSKFDRLLDASRLVKEDRAPIGRFPVTRIERQDVLKAQQRIRRPLQLHQNVAEVFPQLGDIRLELLQADFTVLNIEGRQFGLGERGGGNGIRPDQLLKGDLLGLQPIG
jgi:hypothetical protein